MTDLFVVLVVAMLAMAVLGVMDLPVVLVLRFSPSHPDKNDHHQKRQQRTAEHDAGHTVKDRQTAKGAQSVPDGHKNKEDHEQISGKPHLPSDKEAEDADRRPKKHIKKG